MKNNPNIIITMAYKSLSSQARHVYNYVSYFHMSTPVRWRQQAGLTDCRFDFVCGYLPLMLCEIYAHILFMIVFPYFSSWFIFHVYILLINNIVDIVVGIRLIISIIITIIIQFVLYLYLLLNLFLLCRIYDWNYRNQMESHFSVQISDTTLCFFACHSDCQRWLQ